MSGQLSEEFGRKLPKEVRIISGSNLLQIEFAAGSAAVSQACLAKVVEQLTQPQEAVGVPLIKALKDQLTLTKKQTDSRQRYLEQFEAWGGSPIAPTSIEAVLAMLNSEELIKLQPQHQDLSRSLTEPFTQPAKLLAPAYSSVVGVPQSRLAATICGLIGGLCFRLLALFLNRALSHYRSYLSRPEGQDAQ